MLAGICLWYCEIQEQTDIKMEAMACSKKWEYCSSDITSER
jgi:hypothetical protein